MFSLLLSLAAVSAGAAGLLSWAPPDPRWPIALLLLLLGGTLALASVLGWRARKRAPAAALPLHYRTRGRRYRSREG